MCRIKSVGININDYWKIWELIRWCWTFWRYPMKRLVLSYFFFKFILIWSQISRKVTMIFSPELLGSESPIWWALSPLVCGSHKKDALLSKGTWQASRSGKGMALSCHLVLRRRSRFSHHFNCVLFDKKVHFRNRCCLVVMSVYLLVLELLGNWHFWRQTSSFEDCSFNWAS